MDNTIYLICTIGNSDVQAINKNFFEEKNIGTIPNRDIKNHYLFQSPFFDGKKILQNIQYFIQYLKFPIIDKALDFIKKKQHNLQHLQIILITTNQKINNNTPDTFHKKDTFYYGEIIKHYLKTHYNIEKVTNTPISSPLLIHYDEMFNWFHQKFFNNNKKIQGTIYFLPQGGIDAINFNLTLFLIRKYPHVIQLFVSEKQTIHELKFPQQILYYSYIQPTLENYNYNSLLNLNWFPDNIKNHIHTFLSLLYNTPLNQNHKKILSHLPKTIQQKINDKTFWIKTNTFIQLHNKAYPIAALLTQTIIETYITQKVGELLNKHYKLNTNNKLFDEWKEHYRIYKKEKNKPTPLKPLFEKLDETKHNDSMSIRYHELNITVAEHIFKIHKISDPTISKYQSIYKEISTIRNKFSHQAAFETSEDNIKKVEKNANSIISSSKEEIKNILTIFNQHITKLFLT